MLHAIVGGLFSSLFAVAFIGTGYLLTGSPRSGLVIGAVLLSLMYFGWGREYEYDPVLAAAYGVAHGVIVPIVFVRGGLLAVAVFLWLSDFMRVMILTSDLGTWYAPYMIFTVLALLIVLTHGVRSALVGREA